VKDSGLQITRAAPALCVVIVVSCLACSGDTDEYATSGYVFNQSVSTELAGRWELWSRPLTPLHRLFGNRDWRRPPLLELHAEERCAQSPEFTQFLDRCDDEVRFEYGLAPQVAPSPANGLCEWIVGPRKGVILVTGQRGDGTWRRVNLSTYQHVGSGAVALIGTCNSDPYRLEAVKSPK
jgi:hypothetical protein